MAAAPPTVPSGCWSMFETEGNRPIILIELGAEAIQTYRVLWKKPGTVPDAIVLQDHGFGGNWTTFGARGRLYQYANPYHLPRRLYISINTYPWPGFIAGSCLGDGEGQDEEHEHPRAVYVRA